MALSESLMIVGGLVVLLGVVAGAIEGVRRWRHRRTMAQRKDEDAVDLSTFFTDDLGELYASTKEKEDQERSDAAELTVASDVLRRLKEIGPTGFPAERAKVLDTVERTWRQLEKDGQLFSLNVEHRSAYEQAVRAYTSAKAVAERWPASYEAAYEQAERRFDEAFRRTAESFGSSTAVGVEDAPAKPEDAEKETFELAPPPRGLKQSNYIRVLYLFKGEWFRGRARRDHVKDLLATEAVRHPTATAQNRFIVRWALTGGPPLVLFVGAVGLGLPMAVGLLALAVGLAAGWYAWRALGPKTKAEVLLVIYWHEEEAKWKPLPRRHDITEPLRAAVRNIEVDDDDDDDGMAEHYVDASWYTPEGLHRVVSMSAERELLRIQYAKKEEKDHSSQWVRIIAIGVVGTILTYACQRQDIVQQATNTGLGG
ncbi:MAG: hypothetical protein F4X54_07555 [Chloroflexi bacterium]|nr:hypothetical protein [Chloroflexota bacterium]MYB84573.1 hypothetical protein [Chloroflexota bacterium]